MAEICSIRPALIDQADILSPLDIAVTFRTSTPSAISESTLFSPATYTDGHQEYSADGPPCDALAVPLTIQLDDSHIEDPKPVSTQPSPLSLPLEKDNRLPCFMPDNSDDQDVSRASGIDCSRSFGSIFPVAFHPTRAECHSTQSPASPPDDHTQKRSINLYGLTIEVSLVSEDTLAICTIASPTLVGDAWPRKAPVYGHFRNPDGSLSVYVHIPLTVETGLPGRHDLS